jgi:hypothetical protein
VHYVDDMKCLVCLQSDVVKVASNLSADELPTNGVAFLLSASAELAAMLVSSKDCPFMGK